MTILVGAALTIGGLVVGIGVGFALRDHVKAWVAAQFTYGGGWGDSQ